MGVRGPLRHWQTHASRCSGSGALEARQRCPSMAMGGRALLLPPRLVARAPWPGLAVEEWQQLLESSLPQDRSTASGVRRSLHAFGDASRVFRHRDAYLRCDIESIRQPTRHRRRRLTALPGPLHSAASPTRAPPSANASRTRLPRSLDPSAIHSAPLFPTSREYKEDGCLIGNRVPAYHFP